MLTLGTMAESSTSINSQPPVLRALAEGAWLEFLAEFEAYRAQGGSRPLRRLLTTEVREVLGELGVSLERDEVSEDEEREALVNIMLLFAPKNRPDCYERFRAISMESQTGFSVEAVLRYNLRYVRMQKLCPAEISPSDSRLRDLYIRGLRPARLAHIVQLEEPDSLQAARQAAVRLAKELFAMQRALEVPLDRRAFPENAGPQNQQVKQRMGGMERERKLELGESNGVTMPRQQSVRQRGNGVAAPFAPASPATPQTRCFNCGTRGHRARDCPQPAQAAVRPAGLSPQAQTAAAVGSSMAPAHMTRQATGVARQQRRQSPGVLRLGIAVKQSVSDEPVVVPRVKVQLHAANGQHIDAVALLDTGAEISLVSASLARRMKEHGVLVRHAPQSLSTAAGDVQVAEWISCPLRVRDNAGRDVTAHVEVGVHDTGEEVLLGFQFLQAAGLLDLITGHGQQCIQDGCAYNGELAEAVATSDDFGDSEDLGDDFPFGLYGGDLVVEDNVKQCMNAVLSDFADLFLDLSPDSAAAVPAMPIDLMPNQMPRRQAPRRMSPAVLQQVEAEVTELLRAGVVTPSSSAFASPLVMVRKKDGTRRMCVDFRSLNACTEDLKFPLPHPRTLLEKLVGQKLFATLDLRSGFHQISLRADARRYTAFATPRGLFEYCRVPFGLKNAPAFFQRTMAGVLAGLIGNACEVFIDDIIVFGNEIGRTHV